MLQKSLAKFVRFGFLRNSHTSIRELTSLARAVNYMYLQKKPFYEQNKCFFSSNNKNQNQSSTQTDLQQSHDDFKPQIREHDLSDIQLEIKKWIQSNDVLLFMKGTPKMPRCGFSNYVTGVLKFYGVQYKAVNVLESQVLREAIKKYSNWPTIPQIYIKGTFIGGCDIIKQMHMDGSLEEVLVNENIIKKGNV